MKEIGKVASDFFHKEPSNLAFSFQTMKNYKPTAGDFVTVKLSDNLLVGQVVLAYAANRYLEDPRVLESSMDEDVPPGLLEDEIGAWERGYARIIGSWDGKNLDFSGISPKPSDLVHLLTGEKLANLLGIEKTGLFIGTVGRGDGQLLVKLDPLETLSHNTLICGKIGTGKTYAGGVLIEEFLDAGYPVVAIDPHGELGLLNKPNDNKKELEGLKEIGLEIKSYNTQFFAPPRFSDEDENIMPFGIEVGELSEADIRKIIDPRNELGGKQQIALGRAIDILKNRKKNKFGVKELIDLVNELKLSGLSENSKIGIVYRLKNLYRYDIFKSATDIKTLVKKDTVSIITLPTVPEDIQTITVAVLARKLLQSRIDGDIPKFLFYVEEAHKFVPSGTNVSSKSPLITFAKECRKFGAGVCISTQQPGDLADPIVSETHTKIFLQLDSQKDFSYLKSTVTEHWKPLIEMVPFFPVGRAILKAKTIRFPLIINIRPRRSKHGGTTGGVQLHPKKTEENIDYEIEFEEKDGGQKEKNRNLLDY